MKDKLVVQKVVVPVIFLLIIFFSALTIWALTTPPVMTETVSQQKIYRSISYDYNVYPYVSTLYPAGSAPLHPGESPFFKALTDRIVFSVLAEALEVADNSLDPEAVDLNIKMLIRSPEQWEIEIDDFNPDIIVNSTTNGTVECKSTFELPLEKVQELAEIIAEETEVRPKDTVQLVIQSNLVTSTGERQKNSLAAEFEFHIRGSLIETSEELYFYDDQLLVDTEEKANHLKLLGLSVEVSMGRYLFPPFLFISLLAGGFYARNHIKIFSAEKDIHKLKRSKLKKRYGNRIIEITELKGIKGQNSVVVGVSGMKELARVADELERPILQLVPADDTEENSTRFYVVGDEAVYTCEI